MIRSGLFDWGLPSTRNYSRRARTSSVTSMLWSGRHAPGNHCLAIRCIPYIFRMSAHIPIPYTSETHILTSSLLIHRVRLTISDNIKLHSPPSSNHLPPNPASQYSLDAPRSHHPPPPSPRMRSSLHPPPHPLHPLCRPLPRRHRRIPRVDCVLVRRYAAEQSLVFGKATCGGF
jgi:hypothetical protein